MLICKHFGIRVVSLCCAALQLAATTQLARCEDVESFVEPYRSIDVAAAEPGIIASCDVHEGQEVAEGQVLAKLDHHVQLALLAMGAKSKEFRGRLVSARAELSLRTYRLTKLQELEARGHAQQEEVERAKTDVAIAEGNLLAAQEDLVLKALEYERIQAQIERRFIRAPLAGVVTKIRKDPGEYVPATDPHVLTVVQLDALIARFSIQSRHANNMQVGQAKQVHFPATAETAIGIIEFISPVDDAESGTVRVRIRIDNPEGRYRSGQRCVLQLSDGDRTGALPVPLPPVGVAGMADRPTRFP